MPDPRLSDLQLAILRILWDRGEATAADLHGALCEADHELAPTTVATIVSRLEKRGLVTHRTRGRQYVYRSSVTEQEVRRSMLRRVTQFFFGGETSALLSHLVDTDAVDPDELAAIRDLIEAKERSEPSPATPAGRRDESPAGPSGRRDESPAGPSGRRDESPAGPSGRRNKSRRNKPGIE